MSPRKDRVKPTHYPSIIFHSIRSAQSISSIIVASIVFYFMRELTRDHYALPWTFILLLAVAMLTPVALAITIVLHFRYGLSPMLNSCLNVVLALLWTLAFSLLAWWSSSTLTHVCDVANWDSDLGISVCRMYKALFSFAFLGLISTLCALVLDVRIQRAASRRGRFQQVQMLDQDGKGDGSEHEDGYLETNPNPAAARRPRSNSGAGYALPEEQFAYENTSYQGAGSYIRR